MKGIRRWTILCAALFCLVTWIKTASAQPNRLPTWWELMAKASQPVNIKGEIVAISFPIATVKTVKGEYYIIRLGPWWYWQANNYRLNKGDNVRIIGFKYNDLIFPKVIKTPAGKISLRDDQGRPLWNRHMRKHRRFREHPDFYPPRWR